MTGWATDPGCCPSCGDHKSLRLLTVKEAAAAVGRSEQWIRANAEALGAITMGDGPKSRRYFRASTLDACLTGRESQQPEPPALTAKPTSPTSPRIGRAARTTYRIEE